jgi:hypothetical protein
MVSKVWETMNELEMITSKICSAREIIDAAIDRIQEHQYDKAETMMSAAYEFLGYYLNEFDEKFKLAWQETVVAGKEENTAFFNVDTAGNMTPSYISPIPCDKDDTSEECKKSWNNFWEEPNQYTEEDLNAMCDSAKAEEKVRMLTHQESIDAGRSLSDEGIWMSPQKKDKVKKWVLPVQQAYAIDSDGEYYVNFPDDLLEAANLKEGDSIEWVDNKDGSYILKKVPKTYDEMVAAGYTMTADGFWIKE